MKKQIKKGDLVKVKRGKVKKAFLFNTSPRNKRLTFISKWSTIVSNEVTPIVTGGTGNSQLGGLVA